MKNLFTILLLSLSWASLSQEADYDDLYFNSSDRKIIKQKDIQEHYKPVKKKTYLPSEHQNYTYYTEHETLDTVIHIKKINLNYFYIIPMMVSNWTLHKKKNIHLIYPNLPTAYGLKYHGNLIEFPYPYVYGFKNDHTIYWESHKVNFWMMK